MLRTKSCINNLFPYLLLTKASEFPVGAVRVLDVRDQSRKERGKYTDFRFYVLMKLDISRSYDTKPVSQWPGYAPVYTNCTLAMILSNPRKIEKWPVLTSSPASRCGSDGTL